MDITFVGAVGVLTVFFSLLVKVVGLPDQIRLNHRRKSTEGVSAKNQVIGFLAYFFWTLHGIITKDAVVIIGQCLGMMTTGIIIWQIFRYRGANERE